MGSRGKNDDGQDGMAELHEMRQQAHQMGIEGSSKTDMGQLREALRKVDKGADPMMAKQEAKRHM
jgi:hypothetical protein